MEYRILVIKVTPLVCKRLIYPLSLIDWPQKVHGFESDFWARQKPLSPTITVGLSSRPSPSLARFNKNLPQPRAMDANVTLQLSFSYTWHIYRLCSHKVECCKSQRVVYRYVWYVCYSALVNICSHFAYSNILLQDKYTSQTTPGLIKFKQTKTN